VKNNRSTKIIYQLRKGSILLILLVAALGLLASSKIRGISRSIKQVNEKYIVIAETSSLINDYVFFTTQTLEQFFDSGVGLQQAKEAANVIGRILIERSLRTCLAGVTEPELEESVGLLQKATRHYADNIAKLEADEHISPASVERLSFLQSDVIDRARIVKEQAWLRANEKVEAADKLAQDAVLIIILSAVFVAVAGIAVEGASFVLVRNFTAQRELLLEHYQREAKLERNLREAEVRILQSQINPHFLFNTLNVISEIAFEKGLKRVTRIVNALSSILRYSLKFAGRLVSLSTEIDVAEKYLLIQKERFGERLDYQIELEPAIGELELPAMTLQPLVENALVHGIEPTAKGGHVKIGAFEEEGLTVIEVCDSGQGSDPEALNEALKKQGDDHLGLDLVYKRLQHFYGQRVHMAIFTSPGMGFKVQIKISSEETSGEDQQDQIVVLSLMEE